MIILEENLLKQIAELKSKLRKSFKILRAYDWLIENYVLDFYVDEHWKKLPESWCACLEALQPEQLSELLLNEDQNQKTQIWPLSLLALKNALESELCIKRIPREEDLPRSPLLSHPKLKHLFTKCVKPKKRHEIELMAAICKRSCLESEIDFVVDFGAGQGHLARVLGYGYGIKVCCLEMNDTLNEQARLIDKQFESIASKHLPSTTLDTLRQPVHITMKLNSNSKPAEVLEIIKASLNLNHDDFRFGILGLHPCGDLGAILMRMLLNCPQAKFLKFAGCCYMKLTTKTETNCSEVSTEVGYPLSSYLRLQPELTTRLSYEAREISCHAAEIYYDRLSSGDYEHLKIHSYRAAAERILIKKWPKLKHQRLRSVKHTSDLEFKDYFYKAVFGLPAEELPPIELQTLTTQNDLKNWKRVVIFYTLRLMFAPLIESIILNDRILYMLENSMCFPGNKFGIASLESMQYLIPAFHQETIYQALSR